MEVSLSNSQKSITKEVLNQNNINFTAHSNYDYKIKIEFKNDKDCSTISNYLVNESPTILFKNISKYQKYTISVMSLNNNGIIFIDID